jgi:glycerate kinase
MLLGFHEVKSDRKALKTGNLFIEFQSLGAASGLETTKADWWTFHLQDGLYLVMDTGELKKHCKDKDVRVISGGQDKASKGFLLPLKKILRW